MTEARDGALVAHYFRHEYGRLVARLVRRFGVHELAAIEDSVQEAMVAALDVWGPRGIPDRPSAWLHRAARNALLDRTRTRDRRARILEERDEPAPPEPVEARLGGEVDDELLRMLFVCCHEELPERSRLVLALKILCGFGTDEIAFRLFTTEANVYKRLARARDRLRAIGAAEPSGATLRARLPDVRSVLYLLFNEGYLSIRADDAIRAELCAEAIRLTTIVATHPAVADPTTAALLALMHLHAARLGTRTDPAGDLVLLEEQDRSSWDRERLSTGMEWLTVARGAERLTRFHLEAAIAAEHALAPSFAETDWGRIARYHQQLAELDPSPIHALNRSVALAEAEGPAAALESLAEVVRPEWLRDHYLWDAVLADLHRRAGHTDQARVHRDAALDAAPSEAIARALDRRLFIG